MRVLPYFDKSQVKFTVRYMDKAATVEEWGKYSAMVRMHAMKDGSFVISHVARGKWAAGEREARLKALAQADRAEFSYKCEVVVEQEPGSGGKESAEATIRNLAGIRVYADKVTGSKETRAEPFRRPGAGRQRLADRRRLGDRVPGRMRKLSVGAIPGSSRCRGRGV
jgi:phage terminase large subunit-like protein